MKKSKIIVLGLIITIGIGSFISSASSNGAGSVNDPLATKSYVDQQIKEMLTVFQELIKSKDENDTTPDMPANQEQQVAVSASYKVLGPLPAGTRILGAEGTEVIMRAGKGLAICPGENGLSDVTVGADIKGELEVPLNHLIIIPRQDGRGILIDQEAYLMIRGDYSIE